MWENPNGPLLGTGYPNNAILSFRLLQGKCFNYYYVKVREEFCFEPETKNLQL